MKTKLAATGGAPAQTFVDDVFSTYLYTGNGSTQTITNGIDLAGKGGLVWIKRRVDTPNAANVITDTVRGVQKELISSSTVAQSTNIYGVNSFNTNGFSIGNASSYDYAYNEPNKSYVSWTFRKAAKFFDVQTVTHTNGTSNNIDLSVLGTVGMVIAKSTTTTGDWTVWQRTLTAGNNMQLNTAASQSTSNAWLSVSGTTATLAAAAPTGTYVIYAYAHDTSSTGIIHCGSVTVSGANTPINIGYEPQFLIVKRTDSSSQGDWFLLDSMRGMSQTDAMAIEANQVYWDSSMGAGYFKPTATGFLDTPLFPSGATYIYLAIRRPNKPPTSGTQVFAIDTRHATNPAFISGFPVDAWFYRDKTGSDWYLQPRLTQRTMYPNSTTAESVTYLGTMDSNIGVLNNGTIDLPNIFSYMFKRAPGFFDVVCYTGTGVATTQAHNLGVVPELMIVKERSAINNWWVYDAIDGNTKYSVLNSTAIPVTSSTAWNNTTPTASVFSIGTGANVNASAQTFVAYLFATLAGISKVGSYTGNGSSQNIECGFAAGARFFLVKATSTTGSWWVWDSARGITSGNDPALQLNSTAAEITTADAVDPYSPGITVNQEATCSINASGVSYIFLAIA